MEKRNLPWYAMGALMDQEDVDIVTKVVSECAHSPKGYFRLPEEPEFQRQFAAHEGAKFASAVNSAGTGLDLAMWVLDVGPGDEVITTPLTFVCSATCALLRGAKIVFADIDPVTYNLDPKDVEKKITSKTKVIVPVHFGGVPCDIEAYDAISKKYGVKIVYDAAHAVGSKYKGMPIGGFGDMSVYSFQTNKNMTTVGEGGAITTNNEEYHKRLERIKSFGFQYGPVDDVVELGSTNLLNAAPLDLCFMGVGENGHVAFNDPPVADFDDRATVKSVELEERCRIQQVHDGCFHTLSEVPKRALTVTVPGIMRANEIYCMVPASTKADAVCAMLKGPIGTQCPASILRMHAKATLYLDMDSSAKL